MRLKPAHFHSALLGALIVLSPIAAHSAEIRVLTAGAMKEVVLQLTASFEKETGHTVTVANDTAGGLQKRIEAGQPFDLAVITPAVVDDLIAKGKMAAGSRLNLAQVGIGIAVKEGAPKPDISTVEALKKTLLAARAVAYIDPASGGSSGIYFSGLLDRLGIAAEVKPKAKLQAGGYVADLVVKGEADIAVHQMSELLPVKGVVIVGPLPAEVQRVTVYALGTAPSPQDVAATAALVRYLSNPAATAVLTSKGMEPSAK
jgi:molybdate transport system substrate-binding protein